MPMVIDGMSAYAIIPESICRTIIGISKVGKDMDLEQRESVCFYSVLKSLLNELFDVPF